MGIFDKEQMGFECDPENEDGSQTCRRYKNKGNKQLATGSEFELIPDQSTCKVRVVGRINDGDREEIEKMAKEMETKCKKGF